MKKKIKINEIIDPDLTDGEISNRKNLIDWMCDFGDKIKLEPETIHKAVFHIDRILVENHLKENELRNIALICIILAAKLTEDYCKVDRIIKEFKRNMGNLNLNIMKYEMQIMSNLHWDIHHVSTIEFIQFFLSQGITFTHDLVSYPYQNENTVKSLRKHAEFFADLCLQEYEFVTVDSLLLAAGIIAAARKCFKFRTIWNEELELITTVKENDALNYSAQILNKYNKLFPKDDHKTRSQIAYCYK